MPPVALACSMRRIFRGYTAHVGNLDGCLRGEGRGEENPGRSALD